MCQDAQDMQILQINVCDYIVVWVNTSSIEIHGVMPEATFNNLNIVNKLIKRYPNRNERIEYLQIECCRNEKLSGLMACAYMIDFISNNQIIGRNIVNDNALVRWFIDILLNEQINSLP